MLRWHLQQGRVVIPKSTKAGRIAENIDLDGFELTDEGLSALDGLETGGSAAGRTRPTSPSRTSAATSPRSRT